MNATIGQHEQTIRLLKSLLTGPTGKLAMAYRYLSQLAHPKFPEEFRQTLQLAGNEELDHVTLLAEMIQRLQRASGTSVTSREELRSGWLPSNRCGGDVLKEFQINLETETRSRERVLQAVSETSDDSVRALLHYIASRDAFHQNIWLDAIAELRQKRAQQKAEQIRNRQGQRWLQRLRESLATPFRRLSETTR